MEVMGVVKSLRNGGHKEGQKVFINNGAKTSFFDNVRQERHDMQGRDMPLILSELQSQGSLVRFSNTLATLAGDILAIRMSEIGKRRSNQEAGRAVCTSRHHIYFTSGSLELSFIFMQVGYHESLQAET